MTVPAPRPSALRIVQSASAASLSQVWRLGVTFCTMWVIRRLLGPDELAVWIWVEPLFVLFAIVRDLGTNGHIVRLERRRYGNFLSVELVWGTALALALVLAAPWVATLFRGHDAQTVVVVRVMAAFLWIQGMGMVPLTFFEAEHHLVRAIPAELARNAVFAVLSITWVWLGWGVWGVVLAQLTAAVVFTAVLWFSARGRMRLEFDAATFGAEVRGALPLALLSLLEQAVLYLDVLLLGLALVDRELVGLAGLATYALFFFSRLMADAVGRAVYPAIAAYRDHPERAFGLYRVATLTLVTCFVPLSFFLHHNAGLVAVFLGGDRWAGAADYVRVAAFVPFLRPLTMFGREYLLVAHRDRLLVLYTLGNLVALGSIGWILVTRTDLQEIGMAIASYFPLGTAFLAWGLWQLAPGPFARLLREMGVLYALGLACFGALWVLPLGTWWMLAASCVCGLIFLGLAYRRHAVDLRDFLAWT